MDMARKRPSRVTWPTLACVGLIAAGAAAWSTRGGAGQAYVHPQPSATLAERMAWARGEAKTNGWSKGFWLGFGIRRLMGEHSSMGWHPWGEPEMRLTLDDLVNGRKTPLEKRIADEQALRGTAASMPDAARSFAAKRMGDEPERPVLREIAILLRLPASATPFPADIRISNLNLPFDFEELPFVWVGMAADPESLAFLIPLYAKAVTPQDKRSILRAIGLHRNGATVVPFIERLLAGKETEEIRAEAAWCLGEQNEPRALALLAKTIKADPSEEVREHAIRGLVELELPAAAETLISFALSAADRHVRSEAVRGLAEKATGPAVKALETISSSDKDPEIQKAAIRALAELPRRSGLPYLVSLVGTHPDSAVRAEAVDAIGDVGGAEAVKILTELAKGRRR
jgi:HEAT repeats